MRSAAGSRPQISCSFFTTAVMLAAETPGRSESVLACICSLRACKHTQVMLHLYSGCVGPLQAAQLHCLQTGASNQLASSRWTAGCFDLLAFPMSASRWAELAARLLSICSCRISNSSSATYAPLSPAAGRSHQQASLASRCFTPRGKQGPCSPDGTFVPPASARHGSSAASYEQAQQSSCPHAGAGLTALPGHGVKL